MGADLTDLAEGMSGPPSAAAGVTSASETPLENDTLAHLSALYEAADADDVRLFLDHVDWLKVTLLARGLLGPGLEAALESMRETLRQRDRSERGERAATIVEAALERLPHLGVEPPSHLTCGGEHEALAREYLDRLLAGHRREAEGLVLTAAGEGIAVPAIYLEVFEPVLHEVGRLWQLNRISVAQEHFCTAATQNAMSRLYPFFITGAPRRMRLVAACPGEELHEIGLRMVADLLEMDGWDTFYAGANVPASSIVAETRSRGAAAIALSATRTAHIARLREVIRRVRDEKDLRDVVILVGGRPFRVSTDLAARIGADGWAPRAADAVRLARELCR